MFKLVTITFIICCVSVELSQSAHIYSSRSNLPQSVVIEEGIGIAGITIGKSSMSDVVAMYGNDFKLIEHNGYSTEIQYADLGLAFWYCQNNPNKKIFCIEVKSPA